MTDWSMFLWVTIGVIVAVIFPVVSGFIRKEFPPTAALGLPVWVKKYGGLLLFSLITALICLAIWKATNPNKSLEWFTAFLLGFGWESTIEKFQKKTP
jgi:uncharacterized membrane protein YvlD (DUF360 family)